MWYPSVGWTTTDLFTVDREGLGVYDRLEQGVCIAWALFGNEFSIVVEGLDMVLFIWQESNTHKMIFRVYVYVY